MKIATAHLESRSPYSQSAPIQSERKEETSADFEERSWRERIHSMPDGHVFIPPMAFKNCLSEAAKFLSLQIPGKGKATYTKHFEAGVLVLDPLVLPVKRDDVVAEKLFLPSDGIRGGGKRVWKRYPLIKEWKGTVDFTVLDENITEDVFLSVLRQAGNFIGIGRWRPRNNGMYGRFAVMKVIWHQVE